jgi:hypothetical protein
MENKKNGENKGLVKFDPDFKGLESAVKYSIDSYYDAGIPKHILETGDEKAIFDYVAPTVMGLLGQYENTRLTMAMFQTAIRIKLGAIFTDVNEKLGTHRMLEFGEQLRISKRAIYNYISIFKHRHENFIATLPPTKALHCIELLQNDEVQLKGDKLVINMDGENIEIGAESSGETDFRYYKALVKKHQAMKKELETEQKNNKKLEDFYEKQLKKNQEEIAALNKRVAALSPADMETELDSAIVFIREKFDSAAQLIVKMNNMELTPYLRAKLHNSIDYMHTILSNLFADSGYEEAHD